MKKFMTDIRTLAALLIAGAAMTACSSDDSIIDEQPVNPAQKTYTLTVNASKGDGATRALSLDGSTLNASWAEGEQVTVYNVTKAAALDGYLEAQTSGSSTKLSGTLTGTIEAGDNLTLKFCSDSYNSQNGTLAYIAANCDYAEAPVTVSTVAGGVITTTADADFENKQAIVKFTLKDKANDAAISPSALTVTDGTSTVELTSIPDDTYSTNGAGVLYVAFPAAGSDKTITLTATVGSDTYTYTTSSAKTFVNGQYYEITVKMTKQVTITDLSMVDCAGNARANGMSTANCYMVHTAGKYKLPLVYGNAIKNGETNAAAYTGITAASTGRPTTLTFPRHDGEAIADPWIKNNGITVTTAELLWQDAQGLVTAVDIDGDYLTLTVGKNATAQEGNALIAAKAADGTIVWSWHIWVTKQTFATLTTVDTGSHTYQLTPVNLGWVGDATSGATGYCTFYQWGRKDAFKGTGSCTDENVYDINNAPVTGITHTDDNSVTIGGNIQNPTVHYCNTSSTFGPCNTKYYNMWDAQQTSNDENTAAATVKTVYDPCPPGFCVPTSGLYNYIKSQNIPTWNTGYTYPATNGVFFPASGYRNFSSGDLYGVGTDGRYWSATPKNITHGHYFKFDSGSWALSSNARAMGCPVRAVAE